MTSCKNPDNYFNNLVHSYNYSARTSERTQYAAVMSTDLLIMYKEIMTALWEKAAKEISTL